MMIDRLEPGHGRPVQAGRGRPLHGGSHRPRRSPFSLRATSGGCARAATSRAGSRAADSRSVAIAPPEPDTRGFAPSQSPEHLPGAMRQRLLYLWC